MTEPSVEVTLAQLRYFVVIAEEGGFHAAAERLGRTQPALSHAMRALEDQLGAALFEHGMRASLTAFGEAFYPMAKDVIQDTRQTLAEARRLATGRLGRVTVAAVPSAASRLMPEIGSAFLRERPEVELTIADADAATVRQQVLSRSVDWGIASLAGPEPDLAFTPLFTDPIGLACASTHPLAQARGPIGAEAVMGERLIANNIVQLLDDTELRGAFAAARLRVTNMMSLLAFVARNEGVTVLPELAIPAATTGVAFRRLASPGAQREVGLVTLAGRKLSPAAAAFHAHTVRACADSQDLPPAAPA